MLCHNTYCSSSHTSVALRRTPKRDDAAVLYNGTRLDFSTASQRLTHCKSEIDFFHGYSTSREVSYFTANIPNYSVVELYPVGYVRVSHGYPDFQRYYPYPFLQAKIPG